MKPDNTPEDSGQGPEELDAIASAFLENLDPECWAAEAEHVTLVCPLVTFQAWYHAQPEQLRELIAGAASRFLVHEALYARLPAKLCKPVARFKAWLRRPSKDCYHTLARVALLQQAINLGIYLHRETLDDWAKLSGEGVDHFLAAKAEGNANLIAICQEGMDKLPERAMAWIVSARSWRQLCASNLSQEALATWFEIATWQTE